EAFKIDYLNTEVLNQLTDPDDPIEIMEALRASKTAHKIFTAGERIYALRVATETGIYAGVPWKDIQGLTKFKNSQHRGCDSFLDALAYMLDKGHLCYERPSVFAPAPQATSTARSASRVPSPVKNASRAPSPVKREPSLSPPITPARAVRSSSPTKSSHMQAAPATPSPSKAFRAVSPEVVSRTRSVPLGFTSSRGYPIISTSASAAVRPPSAFRAAADAYPPPPAHSVQHAQSASVRFATSSTTRRESENDVTFVDQLDRLNLDLEHPGPTLTIEILRHIIRPPPEMRAERDAGLPPLYLGPDVDRWLANRNLESGDILRYLQAFLWAPDVSDFVRMVGRPGPAELRAVDAEYLWTLLSNWLPDETH
ncbi:hypothetical protein PYCCODRAFT_1471156, partial [Trametes coccinea BRFM310]